MRHGRYAGFALQGEAGDGHFVQRGQHDLQALCSAGQGEPEGTLQRHLRVGTFRGKGRAIDKDFHIAVGPGRVLLQAIVHFQRGGVRVHFQHDARVATGADGAVRVGIKLLQLLRCKAAQANALGRVPGA